MIPLEVVADAVAVLAPRKARVYVSRDRWSCAVDMRGYAPGAVLPVHHDLADHMLELDRTDVVHAAIRNFINALEHEMPMSWWGMSL